MIQIDKRELKSFTKVNRREKTMFEPDEEKDGWTGKVVGPLKRPRENDRNRHSDVPGSVC